MTDEKVILYSSPEAASLRTVTGWVSRGGYFSGDSEHIARLMGCTHIECEKCGAPSRKYYRHCASCQRVIDDEKYKNMPRAKWDEIGFIYSQTREEYFCSFSEAVDALDENETLESMQLVICKPNYARKIDYDNYAEMLSDNDDLPKEVCDAIEAFNAAIDGIILSWYPGKFALDLNDHGAPNQ